MLSEEEKKAIELAKNFIKIDFTTPNGWTGYYDRELNEISKSINILLNLITKLQKENESWKKYCNELDEEITEKNNKIFNLENECIALNKLIDEEM